MKKTKTEKKPRTARKRKLPTLKPEWDGDTDPHEIANAIRGRTILVESVVMPDTYREIRVGKLRKITNLSPKGTKIRREVHFIDGETGGFRAVAVGDIVKVFG